MPYPKRKSKKTAKPRRLSAMARAEKAMLDGDLATAQRLYLKIVERQPQHFIALVNLGTIYLQLENVEEAERIFDRALALEPNALPVLINLANLANQTGRAQMAEEYYRRALALAPDDAEIWHDFARSKKFSNGDPDLKTLETLFATSGQVGAGQNRMYAAFALGKAYEDAGEYDKAFECLATANDLKSRSISFSIDRERQFADSLVEIFSPSFFSQRQDIGFKSELPMFIFGMPRSGTTLVEQILASHSQVHGAGEINDLVDTVKELMPTFPAGAEALPLEAWRALGERYVRRLVERNPNALRVTDKMPRNFYLAGLIATALPDARIIHCRRSPMDTCLSCYSLHFPYGQEFTYDLEVLGRYYGIYMQVMEHWRKALPARMLTLDYESLVADPETETRRLVSFCGLEWDDACLDFHKSKRSTATASAAQVREPIYRRSVERWRRFERELEPLRVALGPYADGFAEAAK